MQIYYLFCFLILNLITEIDGLFQAITGEFEFVYEYHTQIASGLVNSMPQQKSVTRMQTQVIINIINESTSLTKPVGSCRWISKPWPKMTLKTKSNLCEIISNKSFLSEESMKFSYGYFS